MKYFRSLEVPWLWFSKARLCSSHTQNICKNSGIINGRGVLRNSENWVAHLCSLPNLHIAQTIWGRRKSIPHFSAEPTLFSKIICQVFLHSHGNLVKKVFVKIILWSWIFLKRIMLLRCNNKNVNNRNFTHLFTGDLLLIGCLAGAILGLLIFGIKRIKDQKWMVENCSYE